MDGCRFVWIMLWFNEVVSGRVRMGGGHPCILHMNPLWCVINVYEVIIDMLAQNEYGNRCHARNAAFR